MPCYAASVLVLVQIGNVAGAAENTIPREESVPWYERPALLGGIVLAGCLVLNWLFR
jgi:hypothetical protein